MGPGQLQPSTLKSSTFLLINTHTFYPSLIKKKNHPFECFGFELLQGKELVTFFLFKKSWLQIHVFL